MLVRATEDQRSEEVNPLADESFQDAVRRQHDALGAFMRGDTQPYKELYSQRDDATLANPFGGIARGWRKIPDRIDRAATYYRDGSVVSIETISSDHGDEFGYAIEVERLSARIGTGDSLEEVALRTTTVFRREETSWKLVHRHADPVVNPRSPDATFER
jgi:ketosteroid isomerase-like protein